MRKRSYPLVGSSNLPLRIFFQFWRWLGGACTSWSSARCSGVVIRSYHGESTASHPNCEVKHRWARSVLRSGMPWESRVSYGIQPGVLAQSEACVLSKHEVLGSKPRYSKALRYGVVGNISACHADARGSIPRFGVVFFFFMKK